MNAARALPSREPAVEQLLDLHRSYLLGRAEGDTFATWLESIGAPPSAWNEREWDAFFQALGISDPSRREDLIEQLCEWDGPSSG